VTHRSAPWARAFTTTALANSIVQASACRQLLSHKSVALHATNKKSLFSLHSTPLCTFQSNLNVHDMTLKTGDKNISFQPLLNETSASVIGVMVFGSSFHASQGKAKVMLENIKKL